MKLSTFERKATRAKLEALKASYSELERDLQAAKSTVERMKVSEKLSDIARDIGAAQKALKAKS